MGIYGFGSLRDRFATIANVKRDRYVACFDVTPMVVTAVRNSSTIDEFEQIFRYRIQTCRESAFLRKNPPLIVHYTLDNRSPRAKRQTQLQRIMDSQTIVSRVIVPFSDDFGKSHRYDSASSSIAITDKESSSSSRRVAVKFAENIENRPIDASANYVDKTTIDITKEFEIPRQQLRVHDVVDVVRRVLLTPIFPSTTTIEFDYDEGEGEIKVLNWLTDRCNEDPSIDRLVMARDNDVYVYLLSRLRDVASSSSFSTIDFSDSSATRRKRRRDDPTGDSRVFGTNYDSDGSLFEKSGRYLVFHENSDTVLCCWNNIPHDSTSKTWLLQLWLSACFGNDFVHGLLDKRTDIIQRYYDVLERDFLRYSKYFRALNSQAFADSFEELRTGVESSQSKPPLLRRTIRDDDEDDDDDNDKTSPPTDSRKKTESTVFVTVDNAIEQIIMALWLLQKILSGTERVSMESYFITFSKKRSHVADKTFRARHKTSWREKIDDNDDDDDDATTTSDDSLRYWIARHMWSLFYIMELPQNFTKNQRFACCPAIRINTSFDKPFLRKETFAKLSIDRIAVLARSIFLYGI